MEYVSAEPGRTIYVQFERSLFWSVRREIAVIRPDSKSMIRGRIVRRVDILDTPFKITLHDGQFQCADPANVELTVEVTVRAAFNAADDQLIASVPAFESNEPDQAHRHEVTRGWLQGRLESMLAGLRTKYPFSFLAALAGENPGLLTTGSSTGGKSAETEAPYALDLEARSRECARLEEQVNAALVETSFRAVPGSLLLRISYPAELDKHRHMAILRHRALYEVIYDDLVRREQERRNKLLYEQDKLQRETNDLKLALEGTKKKYAEEEQKLTLEQSKLSALAAKAGELAAAAAADHVKEQHELRDEEAAKRERAHQLREVEAKAKYEKELADKEAKLGQAQADREQNRLSGMHEDARLLTEQIKMVRGVLAAAGLHVDAAAAIPVDLVQLREDLARSRLRALEGEELEARRRVSEFELESKERARRLDLEREEKARVHELVRQVVQERLLLMRDEVDVDRRKDLIATLGREVANAVRSAQGVVEHLRINTGAAAGGDLGIDELIRAFTDFVTPSPSARRESEESNEAAATSESPQTQPRPSGIRPPGYSAEPVDQMRPPAGSGASAVSDYPPAAGST